MGNPSGLDFSKRTIVRILNSLQLFEKIDSTNDTCQKSLV